MKHPQKLCVWKESYPFLLDAKEVGLNTSKICLKWTEIRAEKLVLAQIQIASYTYDHY